MEKKTNSTNNNNEIRKFFLSTRLEIPKPRLTSSKILKSFAFVSVFLTAFLATSWSISSEIFLPLVQSSASQQTEQPTLSPSEKTGQNQPAPQQQSSVQQFQPFQSLTHIATPDIIAHLISPSHSQTATLFLRLTFFHATTSNV